MKNSKNNSRSVKKTKSQEIERFIKTFSVTDPVLKKMWEISCINEKKKERFSYIN